MLNQSVRFLARRANSQIRRSNLLKTGSLAAQDRGFFFGKRREPRCDLKNQSIVQADGSRKSAWLGDKPLRHESFIGILTTYAGIRRGPTVGGKEMLGKRVMKNGKLEWEWITYEQAFEISDNVSQAIRKLGIEIGDKSNIGIYSKNRPEWVLSDMAIHNFSNVSVPIYDNIPNEDMHYITNLCEIPLMFVDSEDKTTQLIKDKTYLSKSLKYIVQFDKVSDEMKAMAESNNFQLWSFDEFVELGKKHEHRPHAPPTPETLATISFTSGTTGRPKGAMLTHLNLCSTTVACEEFEHVEGELDSYLSYLPLAHVYERHCTLAHFKIGSRIGFSRGDPALLVEDIQALAPRTFACVPRVLGKIYKSVMSQVQDKPVKKMILNSAIAYKLYHYKMTGKATRDTLVDKYILHKIQMILGPNIKQFLIPAAKTDNSSMRFARGAFGIEILELYGLTETSGPTTIQLVGDMLGSVGPPISCTSIKLVDIAELGYFVDENGGEVLVKGHNVTSGYYKDPKATASAFTEDGFMKTGDIGKFTPEGTLQLIDRRDNVLKLPQGEFVAPDLTESLYISSKFVQQICVHGNKEKPWLVAVVVPDPEYLASHANLEHNIEGKTYEELCKIPALAEDVLRDFVDLTKEHNRPRHEGVCLDYQMPL